MVKKVGGDFHFEYMEPQAVNSNVTVPQLIDWILNYLGKVNWTILMRPSSSQLNNFEIVLKGIVNSLDRIIEEEQGEGRLLAIGWKARALSALRVLDVVRQVEYIWSTVGAEKIFRNKEDFQMWLESKNPGLSNMKPIEKIRRGASKDVEKLIVGLLYGLLT